MAAARACSAPAEEGAGMFSGLAGSKHAADVEAALWLDEDQ